LCACLVEGSVRRNDKLELVMAEVFTGTCQCGAVEYRVTGESINLFICHCTQCQKQSSSAFGMALWIEDYTIEHLTAELAVWKRQTSTGYEMVGEFCRTCGTRLFHRHSANPQVLSIKPGTLHETKHLKPVAHIWTSEAQEWLDFPSTLIAYPEDPPSFEEMIRAWHELQKSPI